jgi:hypothetical protein
MLPLRANPPFGAMPCFESQVAILGENSSVELASRLSIPWSDHGSDSAIDGP